VISTAAEAADVPADMATLVIIGATTTRLIARGDDRPWLYTPRFSEART
jgi:precorrin-3B C17-methyltransferase